MPPYDSRGPASAAVLVPAVCIAALVGALACAGAIYAGPAGGSAPGPAAARQTPSPSLSATARIGEKIFSDQSLSASGKQSCATCHDPAHAHAPANALAVQMGGTGLDIPGFRAVPSLRYLNLTPKFSFAKDGTPAGGLDRDGRAPTLANQAERPLLAPHEMANASKAAVIAKLRRTAYAEQFRHAYGPAILEHVDEAFERMAEALQQFQKEAPQFHSFDSKYDAFLAGKVQLTHAEARGLKLFNDPGKGNCLACHASAKGADGAPPLFTDFTFDNIGVPRNRAIPATSDARYFDFGLCGPDRVDLAKRTDLCGKFKVPTLRNVATRQVFMHNGRFTNLTDVLAFYVRRDTNPEQWYPRDAKGRVQKFDDLPAAYRANVNTAEKPYDRKPGMAPALNAQEISDVIAFLETLNDGYRIHHVEPGGVMERHAGILAAARSGK